jgi:hypothetical protein
MLRNSGQPPGLDQFASEEPKNSKACQFVVEGSHAFNPNGQIRPDGSLQTEFYRYSVIMRQTRKSRYDFRNTKT